MTLEYDRLDSPLSVRDITKSSSTFSATNISGNITITWLRRADTLYCRPDKNDCQPARFIVGPTVGWADNEPEGLTTIVEGPTIQRVARTTITLLLLPSGRWVSARKTFLHPLHGILIKNYFGSIHLAVTEKKRLHHLDRPSLMLTTLTAPDPQNSNKGIHTPKIAVTRHLAGWQRLLLWWTGGLTMMFHIQSDRVQTNCVLLTHGWNDDNALVIAPPCDDKQRVLMHGHQGWNVRHGLCHIYMRDVYIYELCIAFVSFVVCSLL